MEAHALAAEDVGRQGGHGRGAAEGESHRLRHVTDVTVRVCTGRCEAEPRHCHEDVEDHGADEAGHEDAQAGDAGDELLQRVDGDGFENERPDGYGGEGDDEHDDHNNVQRLMEDWHQHVVLALGDGHGEGERNRENNEREHVGSPAVSVDAAVEDCHDVGRHHAV
eukprot:scaffold18366_cov34-Prasinocladus_malaysianus.AAC.1